MAKPARSTPLPPSGASPPATARPPSRRSKPAQPPTLPSRTLDVFDNPQPARDYAIQFQIPEFTCTCPLTGQPDFAHFTIDMVCDRLCVELKSLKLYFWSYRDEGAFHEKVTNQVLDDIVAAIQPRFVRVSARWYVRGGIYTNIVAEHCQPGWLPQPTVALAAHPHESGLGR